MKSIAISPAGYGHFKITTTYRGKELSGVTTNTQAIDRYRDTDISAKTKRYGYTHKQAAKVLHNEVVRKNSVVF